MHIVAKYQQICAKLVLHCFLVIRPAVASTFKRLLNVQQMLNELASH